MSLKHGSAIAEVVCGPGVETGDDFFVEGTWDNDFDGRGFDHSALFMGSGGKLSKDGLVIATPCHNLEALYLVLDGDRLIVSNSLPFLLVRGELELDVNWLSYKGDMRSSLLGLDRCVKNVPTRNGPSIRIMHYTNLKVDKDLAIEEIPKPSLSDWESFDHYRSFMVEGLRRIKDNAGTPQRRVRYELLSTISTGYDSPASAAIAAQAGAEHAVTICSGGSEESREFIDDSGADIARILGLQITEYPLPDLQTTNETIFAEFAACGDTTEANFIALEQVLENKIITTGNSGGFWRLDFPPTNTLARPDPGGSSLGELRLRVGFIHIPVPMMGATLHPRLYAISSSPEMAPWSLASDYNRPIPRRILEEKGVPREFFGQVKKGGVILGGVPPGARAYYFQHRAERSLSARAQLFFRWRRAQLLRKVTTWAERLDLRRRRFDDWNIPRPGAESLIVQWGVSVLKERYRHDLTLPGED
jgi:hypothetical protein